MTRATLFPACAALALLLGAGTAEAQQTCTIQDQPQPRYVRRLMSPTGGQMTFISGRFRIACTGGILVSADSAHNNQGTGELRLVGDVFYQDSARTMNSERATYLRDQGRLLANTDVVLHDLESPTEVRGQALEYERELPTRPRSRLVVTGRPRAYLYDEGTPPLPAGLQPSPLLRIVNGDTVPAALQVDADRLELVGDERMIANVRVQMVREDVRAFGDVADYDRAAGSLDLRGSARVEGDAYDLFGDHIVAGLDARQLDHVLAEGSAALVGEDIEVYGSVIRAFLTEGKVERLVAVATPGAAVGRPGRDSRAPAGAFAGVDTDGKARAYSRDFALSADSIEAVAPEQQLRTVVAVGGAYSERQVDSLGVDLPRLIDRDWLRGDTITGRFATRQDTGAAAPDSAKTVLEHMTAIGGAEPARSLYRMEANDARADEPAVNYMIAKRIDISFDQGDLKTVDAEGPVRGIYLEPKPAATPASTPPAEEAAPAAPPGEAR